MNKQLRTHFFTLAGLAAILGIMILWQVVSGTTRHGRSSGGSGTAGVADGRELVDAKDKAAAARELGKQKSKDSVPYLIAYLKDPDPEVRIAVTDALGSIGDPRAANDLVIRLENEMHAGTRAAIVRALGNIGRPDAIPKILRCVDDPDTVVRLAAVEALTHWAESNAVSGIAHATSDMNETVRAAAGERLSKIGGAAIPFMLDVMDEGSQEARIFRIKTISAIDSDATIPALVRIMCENAGLYPPTDNPVRKAAMDELAAKGEPAAQAAAYIPAMTGHLPLKAAAAALFVRMKSPSGVKAATDRLLAWKAMTSTVEWRMWTDMIKTIDTPLARESSEKLQAHYAMISTNIAQTAAVAARPAIAPRRPIDASGYSGELSLLLQRSSRAAKDSINLDLEMSAASGAWERIWGCNSFNRAIHEGLVLEARTTADSFDLLVGVMVGDDPWINGGFLDVKLKLKRPAGGKGPIDGSYEGTFKGAPVSGSVTGEERPPRPVVVKDFIPLHPEEHPRLLFRRHELAAIRKRAATPFGLAYQEACSKTGDPLNQAMLYQITGDESFAEAARSTVASYNEDLESMEDGFGSGGFGHRLVRTMLAYDLCYDVWPEEFKKQIRDHLRLTVPALQKYIGISGANYHPCCNYYGPGRGAPAIAALVVSGEKGPKPESPPDPFSKPSVILPASDYTPSQDTPVVDLVVGRLPERWLFAGPGPFALAPSAEESLLKSPSFRPQPGTVRKSLGIINEGGGTRMGEAVFTFTAMPKEMIKDGAVDFATQLRPEGDSTFLLSTVIKVEKEQTVSVVLGGASSMWINGTRLDPEGCCLLRPGLYSMMAVCTVQAGRTTLTPRLVDPNSPEMAVRHASHRFRMALWQTDCEDWERYGGADQFWMRRANIGYWQMYAHYRVGIGDGGFQAETGSYADIASWFPLVYAGFATRTQGRYPSPHPDITHMVPRRMMQVYFPADGGKPSAQKLNSCHGLRAAHCAAIFQAIPEQYQAPVLWGWNRVNGVSGKEGMSDILNKNADAWGSSLGAALTFLNYPLDMKPVEPAKAMPLTWEAKTFGYYCFRSGWEGKDEFIAQVFLKAFPIGGWNDPNAGAFRLFGLGSEWVTGNEGKAGIRQFEPVVVLLPEWVDGTDTTAEKIKADKAQKFAIATGQVLAPKKQEKPEQAKAVFNQSALGHLMYNKAEQDGSGVLSMDLNDVYSAAQPGAKPSGITGIRSIAFDYSRKSGSPCLVAIVDKIEGNVDKVWLWPLPNGCLSNTVVKGNTFTIRQGDATLKGTFISPANVNIEAASDRIVHQGGRLFDKDLERVKATGDGSFFVVITIQRGDAPSVSSTGQGLDATVKVGNRTVRFDGNKIMLTD